MDAIYLDYAAATPLDPAVFAVMEPFLADNFYNPSASYLHARAVGQEVQAARAQIAGHLGARPSEIIFTAGGTEANNLAINGIMTNYPDANLVVSAIEHESILRPAQAFNARLAPVDEKGIVELSQLSQLIDDQTVLVSIMYTSNEVGSIQPLRQIANLLKEVRGARLRSGNKLPLYFHTDAAQAGAYLDLHVSRLGVDLLTLNGGKIYGPKQTGILFVDSHVNLAPQILGGGQERGRRSGTENVAGIIGLAHALDLVTERRHDESKRLTELQHHFLNLIEDKLPDAILNGSRRHRLPNNVHITLPGFDNERLLMQLDEAGIMCATGSACSASSGEPSHVLKAMGVSDHHARSSLRFTMGKDTTEKMIEKTVAKLEELTRA